MRPEDQLSKTEREALKAIHRLTVERHAGGSPDAGARTGDLSNELGLTPGTITLSIKRLAEAGYVNHHPYRGVHLTDKGMRAATAAIRRHRIVERFLSDSMGYSWQDADRLAPSFEHALPAEVETRMYEMMNRPDACPHGFPIPEPDAISRVSMDTLNDLANGESATVALSGSIESEVLEYLDDVGIKPASKVQVIENRPVDGVISLSVNGETRVIGERVARNVFVRREEIIKEQSA